VTPAGNTHRWNPRACQYRWQLRVVSAGGRYGAAKVAGGPAQLCQFRLRRVRQQWRSGQNGHMVRRRRRRWGLMRGRSRTAHARRGQAARAAFCVDAFGRSARPGVPVLDQARGGIGAVRAGLEESRRNMAWVMVLQSLPISAAQRPSVIPVHPSGPQRGWVDLARRSEAGLCREPGIACHRSKRISPRRPGRDLDDRVREHLRPQPTASAG
jgi:hypothetical protein